MPVVLIAPDGDEDLPGAEAAAIGRDPVKACAMAERHELTAGRREDVGYFEGRGRLFDVPAHGMPPMARRTSSRSSSRRFSVPTIW